MHTLAPAKINLYLGISSQTDACGYHMARTVMTTLALGDEVEVELADAGGIQLACEPEATARPEDNLAWRAASLLAETLGVRPDVRIRVRKRIPSQAGLGGGSSDAAAVLRRLAACWGVPATDARVLAVARGLGADVPFFLYGGTCLMEGRGDVHARSFELPRIPVVLVKPPAGVSTAQAYRTFDSLATPAGALEPLLGALEASDVPGVCAALSNNLQPAACEVEPLVAEALAWLGGLAPQAAAPHARPLLCGSGACCALACVSDEAAASVAERACAERGWWACATHTA